MKINSFLLSFCLTLNTLAQTSTGTNNASAHVTSKSNEDESKVPQYVLPDPLVCVDGTRVTSVEIWENKRRPELVKLFEENEYGRAPGRPSAMHFELTSLVTNALDGIATRKEITIWFTRGTNGPALHLLTYIPDSARGPVPAFLGLNFSGNHAISTDPGITLSGGWFPAGISTGCVTNNHATDACRGKDAAHWPVEKILSRGYALATFYYGDLEPDFTNGWKLGVRAALSPDGTNAIFKPDDWGAIAAWAWGASRALDYLETDPSVNARRVALIGHSRLGKAALWAGARDQRFAMVIGNDSGHAGAALARRGFGETTAAFNSNPDHAFWFCANFRKYSNHDDQMPIDQHELIALIAPRPVYLASAQKDLWSDPRGEFLGALGAEPVYQLYGETGLGVTNWPRLNHPVGDFIGYHIRPGKHDITDYDWNQYLNFADRHLKQ
jgi:hypothetical protein